MQFKVFFKTVYVIWLREMIKFIRERTRIIIMISQPLLYLLILGQGLRSLFQLDIEGFDYLTFMYPGIVAMSILFTATFSAVSIIWDREFGFLKEVLVAPVPRSAVAFGKIVGGSSTSLIQGLILLLFAPLAGLSLSIGIIAQIIPILLVMAFAITSLGIVLAAYTDSMEGFQMITNFIVIPLFLLSGAFFPLGMAPEWMQVIMKFNPVVYGVDALRNVMFTDAAVRELVVYYSLSYDLLILGLFSVSMILLSMWAFSRME